MSKNHAEALQALRFIVVGGVATLTHMGVAALLFALLHGRYIALVNFIAWLVAFGVSFWGHQRVTFKRQTTLRRFLLMSLAGLATNYAALGLLLLTPLPQLLAMITAIASAAVSTYLLARYYTFASVSERPE
ncbi:MULTISPECIES: GtrA family protein [Halomonas]|uniref:GtrA family protein n=1 Tax=Halomonas TaxID=2745 RepID=UPI000EEE8B9C|nr:MULTISPECIES: GtrA family protein [Halomonas]HCR97954.1 GtrA family protein [Halomonas sp.]